MVQKYFLAIISLLIMSGLSQRGYSAGVACQAALDAKLSTEQVLAREKRSEVQDLRALAVSEEGQDYARKYKSPNDKQLFKVIKGAAKELLKMSKGRKVFLFARDGELFHDALVTILMNHPKGSKLLPNFNLINVSRPIVRQHSTDAVRKFVKSNGMDLEAVLNGSEKMLWIDTGFRGSIYLALFNAAFELIDFAKPAAEVTQQILNVLTGVEALLVTTKGKPSVDSVISAVSKYQWKSASELTTYLNNYLYFNEFLVAQRKELDLPETQAERYQWIVQNIEHNYHFNGRALNLSADSKTVAAYEIDAETNKEFALAQQLRFIRIFSEKEIQEEFAPIIDELIGEEPKAKPIKEKPKVKEAISVEKALKANLVPGDLIKTVGGQILEFVAEGGTGRRGVVYKVKNDKGEFLALKLAKNNDASTLASFAEESEKAKDAETAGFRVAKIFEHKNTYIVKEWVEGILAKEWLQSWAAKGYDRNDKAFIALKETLKESARRGLYTGDLNRKNAIWNSEWIIIDSGSTTNKYTAAEAWERYSKNISSRWSKELGANVAAKFKEALEE